MSQLNLTLQTFPFLFYSYKIRFLLFFLDKENIYSARMLLNIQNLWGLYTCDYQN